jgi:hypothetical protein
MNSLPLSPREKEEIKVGSSPEGDGNGSPFGQVQDLIEQPISKKRDFKWI